MPDFDATETKMPSRSLMEWRNVRLPALDEVEQAHAAIGGMGPGRRFATQQINHAYVMLLSGHFQGYCRDLHSEIVGRLIAAVQPRALVSPLSAEWHRGRKLDQGNPSPANIGADFNRLGMELWSGVYRLDKRNSVRREKLDMLNDWRNAIAHQNFVPTKLHGMPDVRLADVRRWRAACDALASAFDQVCNHYIQQAGGVPW